MRRLGVLQQLQAQPSSPLRSGRQLQRVWGLERHAEGKQACMDLAMGVGADSLPTRRLGAHQH